MGVWIETLTKERARLEKASHPAWVCGLKQRCKRRNYAQSKVTPCVGVWIETKAQQILNKYLDVTPCVGVWIETYRGTTSSNSSLSHPAWVCGLKQNLFLQSVSHHESHPAWVCGLKQLYAIYYPISTSSHPAWVCGLKQ